MIYRLLASLEGAKQAPAEVKRKRRLKRERERQTYIHEEFPRSSTFSLPADTVGVGAPKRRKWMRQNEKLHLLSTVTSEVINFVTSLMRLQRVELVVVCLSLCVFLSFSSFSYIYTHIFFVPLCLMGSKLVQVSIKRLDVDGRLC